MKKSWNKELLLILVILLVGLSLRVWGLNQGLPSSYYPDERHFINRAMSFGTWDFNPHWFHKPALYMYILFLEYGLYFLIGKAAGLFTSLQDFARLYVNDLTSFLIIGRLTTVLLGTATIWLVYKLGRRMYGRQVALSAAVLLAFTFAHVKSSQWVKADVPMAFFAFVSFYFIYRILEEGRYRHYVLAGLFAGLGTATKYTPVVLLVPIFFAHVGFLRTYRPFQWSRIIDGHFLSAILFLGLGFFIGSPYNFLDPYWAKSNLALWLNWGAKGMVGDSRTPLVGVINVLFRPLTHLARVLTQTDGLGPIMGTLAMCGLLFLLCRGRKGDRLIALTMLTVVYMSDFLFSSYADARHFNIIYPFVCLAGATLVAAAVGRVVPSRSRIFSLGRPAMLAILIILIILPSAYSIVRYDLKMARKDTRTVAKEWIEAHIPSGSRILVDDYCVPLKMSPDRVRMLLAQAEGEKSTGPFTAHAALYYRYYLETVEEPTFFLYEISHPWWMEQMETDGVFPLDSEYDRDMGNPLKEWGVTSLEAYRSQGYEFLVTTDEIMGRYPSAESGACWTSFIRFYRQVGERAVLLRRFDPRVMNRPGPNVLIYRLTADD